MARQSAGAGGAGSAGYSTTLPRDDPSAGPERTCAAIRAVSARPGRQRPPENVGKSLLTAAEGAAKRELAPGVTCPRGVGQVTPPGQVTPGPPGGVGFGYNHRHEASGPPTPARPAARPAGGRRGGRV